MSSSSMACLNIEIPKKPANKTPSEHRRATKPIMEKRRRARINHSLNELKSLILDALHKDPTRNSKLEKADILEMTVRHLQNVQRQTMALEIARDPSVLSKYRAGFSECATEVSRYISKIDGADHHLKQRLTSHLTNCLQSLPPTTGSSSTSSAASASIAFPGMSMFTAGQSPLQVHIPAGHSIFSTSSSSAAGTPVPVNLTTSSSDLNNNHRRGESESKLTPPASATSSFSFSFPATSTMSPVTPTTPSTPGSNARLLSPSGYQVSDFRFNPYHRSSWPARRELLRSISPGSSSSSMGSLSPAGSDSIDCDSIASCDKKEQKEEDVWRPW